MVSLQPTFPKSNENSNNEENPFYFNLACWNSKLVKPTNPLLEICAPPYATKTMHIHNYPHQHGNNEIHQALVSQV